MRSWTVWTAGALVSVLHAIFVQLVVNRVLPDPYMDEIFHVNQTRRWCSGAPWTEWNPKITTPPGLYLLAFPLFCGRERLLNSVLIGLGLVAVARLRRISLGDKPLATGLVVLLLPVLLHSSILFYTDLLSVLLISAAFASGRWQAVLLFAASLLVRQTNIVWAAAWALLWIWRRLDIGQPVRSFVLLSIRLWAFVLLALGFGAFIVWNDYRIVLGDPEAHRPVWHLAQLSYFALFVGFTSWPLLLSWRHALLHSLQRRRFWLLLFVHAIMLGWFAYDHPYLLADNRHLTFYAWRRWLGKGVPYRLALAPLAALSTEAILFGLDGDLAEPVVGVLATSAVLVPAHLLEPRYFIVSFVLWRLTIRRRIGWLALVVELLWQVATGASVIYLFLYRPFRWPHDPADWQRFMW